MKVLFYYRGREGLGIEYLSSILKKHGHETDLIFDPGLDNNFYWKSRMLKRFHDEEAMFQRAERFNPDLIAFSSTTNEYPSVCRIAGILKKRLNVPVIVGGIQPTSLPEYVLSNPSVDMICVGEGELALLELAEKISTGDDYTMVKNIWLKKSNGDFIRNDLRDLIQDLDSLPFPDKEMFYRYGCFKNLIQIMTSRGCPFSCSYCHNNVCRTMYKGKGNYIRRRSVQNVIEELVYFKNRYSAKGISFQDDLFVMDSRWIEEFSESYISQVSLPFSCNAFPTRMDEKTVALLKRMGCMDLFIGIDAGNEELRRNVLHRNTPVARIRENVALAKKHNIPVELSAVFCFPGETPEEMWETVDLVNELNPSAVQSHILFPFPGTDVFRISREMGLIDDKTEEIIYRGDGSIVGESVLNHPYKDTAYVLAKMMAVYVKLPAFLKPLFRRMMTERMKPVANAVFLLTIPFVFPWQGIIRFMEMIRMIRYSRKHTRETL